ncbi:MAG TPA: methyltransferase domain-containing protein [Acidimicrobiales bacterium]|nr:methyltransferase domain-containing protein [Acidimicrobiales bacterium]
MTPAAERWASELGEWAIPDEILAVAPESPWTFSPGLFTAPADFGPDTPSRRRAREALSDGGMVLDVGCGGGAAGLALVPPAGRVVGFDQGADLLAAFSSRAAELGVDHEALQGHWPEDAAKAPVADVVVCHHVAYNVPEIGAFAVELAAHARRRVVMELTGRHPRFGVNDLWRHFWNLERPSGPTADDAAAALAEAGIRCNVERSPRVARQVPTLVRVASVRRYLCLPAERDPEIEALLGAEPELAGEVVTLWWDAAPA